MVLRSIDEYLELDPEEGTDGEDAPVEGVMTRVEIRTARAADSIRDVASKMDKVSGLPVVDEGQRVVGVVTRSDLLALETFDGVTVGEVMKSPAVTVAAGRTVGEACSIMIANKVHRVPVVDDEGRIVGVLSRTNLGGRVSRSLRSKLYSYPSRSLDAYAAMVERGLIADTKQLLEGEAPSPTSPASAPKGWTVSYLYDGDCPVCRNLKLLLETNDKRQNIWFVNLADPSYKSSEHKGVSYEDAMAKLHAIRRDGTIFVGLEALNELYKAAGMGWVAALSTVPGVGWLAKKLVDLVSALRLPMMGQSMQSLQALKKLDDEAKGTNKCSEDTECELDWDELYGDDGGEDIEALLADDDLTEEEKILLQQMEEDAKGAK
ncbi:unnamed protein product [Pedinophyceae sp. YPF-701]|nr:unnamed protein product [Pedinophyceae sp. YPF-701]